MCRKAVRYGLCGHQLGPASWYPEDPEECRLARQAFRRHARTGKLLRCSPTVSTTVIQDDSMVCPRPDCYINHILVGRGWLCCECRSANPGGTTQCDGSVRTNQPPYYEERCLHYPCSNCRPGGGGGGGSGRRRRR